jgi:hypothetical protein
MKRIILQKWYGVWQVDIITSTQLFDVRQMSKKYISTKEGL